jgi:hypothetical protein
MFAALLATLIISSYSKGGRACLPRMLFCSITVFTK